MKKLSFIIVLAVAVLIAVGIGTNAQAATIVNSGTCGTAATWTLDSDGTLVISGSGATNDYTSTKSPFYYSSAIKKIIIGDEITSIGNYLFRRATKLEHVTIGKSVTTIKNKAFYQCSALKTVIMPASLTSVGPSAFESCSTPKDVYISDMDAWCNIRFIDGFSNPLNNFGNLYLNNNLVTDFEMSGDCGGQFTFCGCVSLKTVTIKEGVTTIPTYMFNNCDSLQKIEISEGVITIGDYAVSNCDALQNVSIPNSVTTVGERAFSDSDGIKTLTVGKNVETVRTCAFAYLKNLEYVLWDAKEIKQSGYQLFETIGENGPGVDFVFGDNVEKISHSILNFFVSSPDSSNPGVRHKVNRVTIGKNVSSIDGSVFSGLYTMEYVVDEENQHYSAVDGNLYNFDKTIFIHYARGKENKEYTVLQGTTKIAPYALGYMINLETVILPDTVKTIDEYAFGDCYGLKNIVFGNGLTDIGKYAFKGCIYLAEINLPDSLRNIGSGAFGNCDRLKTVSADNSELNIGGYAFTECDALETALINAKNVGSDIFSYCKSLKTVTLGEDVQTIGSSVFHENTALEKVYWNAKSAHTDYAGTQFKNGGKNSGGFDLVFGDSVETIPANLLYGSSSETPNVKSVTFGKNVKSVGDYAFYDCVGVTALPEKLEYAGLAAFYGCDNIRDVTISAGYFGRRAFANCNGLQNVTINGGYFDGSVFWGCENLENVEVTTGNICAGMFGWCYKLKNITIGENVTSMDGGAFDRCFGLEKLYWNAKNLDFTENSFNNTFEYAGRDSNGVDVVFSDTVETIPAYLFTTTSSDEAEIPNIKTLTIGKNVTKIGHCAFYDCKKLEKLYWNAKNVENFKYDHSIFNYDMNPADVIFGNEVENIPDELFDSVMEVNSIIIGSSVKRIGNSALGGTNILSGSIVIPESVVEIGENNLINNYLSTIYYNGTESDFKERISFGGEYMILYMKDKMIYADKKGEKTSVSSDKKYVFVDSENIEKENTVILALYNNGIFAGLETAVCKDGDIIFEPDKTYTEAKVMVWQDLGSIIPACNAEKFNN